MRLVLGLGDAVGQGHESEHSESQSSSQHGVGSQEHKVRFFLCFLFASSSALMTFVFAVISFGRKDTVNLSIGFILRLTRKKHKEYIMDF